MIAINIDPSLELVTIKFTGFTTAADIMLAMDYCASSDVWRDHYNYFFDLREMVVGFSMADFPRLITNLHKLKALKQTKHACVVSLHTHYAVTIAWKKVAALHGVRFKSSFSCPELSEWLGISLPEITRTLEAEPLFTFTTDDGELQTQYR